MLTDTIKYASGKVVDHYIVSSNSINKILYNKDAYINSIKQINANAKEKIENYGYLEERAIASAEKQVSELAQMLAEPGTSIEIRFMETEGNGQ